MQIRPARIEDTDPVTQVIGAAYAPLRADLVDLPEVTAGVADQIAGGGAWVAEQAGTILGVVLTSRTGTNLHIVNLAVSPAAAGSGIGSALMAHVERMATDDGIERLRLATHRDLPANVAFYGRRGWRVTERDGSKVLMERVLPSPAPER